ncbi:outer membrane protein assembly factor BamB [Pusillimonas sp. CC-YST705]|uniref:Outer membrane protein assembly factor BamB n=1 Tax=Mesopusillimonas faecipullorum TaxID=2755040 RepID=A0ABS8CA86_9BURK|nr:outer membrane protein assembly factor BamB [Mesopusillimonas faecipullorum]MCB5362940.1 outer membrane protein assembly factor BamB [Mesopusillimonas faecipullorum]
MSKRIHRPLRVIRNLALSATVAALAGCSMFSSKDARYEPSPLTEYAPGASVNVIWTASVGRGSGSSFAPAVAGGWAYAATPNGTVTKLDLSSGAIQWQANISPDLSAGVGSDGQTTAVAAVDGSIIAFDDNGNEKWRTRATGRVDIPPAVGAGVVVVRSSDYRIQAFDAETGEAIWNVQRPGPALALKTNMRMIIIEGLVISGLPNGRLIAIGAQDGSVQWEGIVSISRGATDLERISDIVGEPQAQGPILCGVAYQGNITCFNVAQGGYPLWEQPFSSTTGLGSDRVNVYAANQTSVVHAFQIETGEPTWSQADLRNRRLTSPAVVAPGILVGDYQGYVHVLARTDGALLGRTQLGGGAIVSPPLATDRGVLVQTGSGNLALIGVN